MTKFVPKEVLGDSTFVAVYDPESGDTGYVRMGDLVDKSETTVTAVTSPGGGIEIAGGIQAGVYLPPEGFSVPPQLAGIKAFFVGDRFGCNITPESLIDTSTWSNTYYVDNVGGLDASSGLTWALRKKSIGNALRTASASGLPSRVLVWNSGIPYWRQVSAGDDGSDRNSNVPILMEAMNGRVQTGTYDNLTWVKTGGLTNVYQAARSNAYRCVNPSVKDSSGIYADYVWVASTAACDALEGSWYTDNVNVYIHPHNKVVPTLANARVILHATGFNWSNNQNLVVRGFDFEGGVNGAIRVRDGSTNTVVVDDCTFRYGTASNTAAGGETVVDGVQILGCGLFAAFDCRADRNSKDGFNLHANAGVVPSGLFVRCFGTLNGMNPSTSNNGFTTHDGIKSVSIGCDWRGNYGMGSGHISDGTQVWSVGDVSGASMGDPIYAGNIPYGGFGVWLGAAEMWMDSCRDTGTEWGVIRLDTAALHLRNHRGSGQRSAGITAF